MKLAIVKRYSQEVLWTGEGDSLRFADLRFADLRGAYLRGADLRVACLQGADLRGADLRVADLRIADLRGADLRGADLRFADLRGADLRVADLRVANLRFANLRDADLKGADLRFAKFSEIIPKIENIDAAILAAVRSSGCSLEMDAWHTCETTHCRAGWAIHLAGEAGKALEYQLGSAVAGALIYAVSRPNKPIPNFYAATNEALLDLIACAEETSPIAGETL